MEKLTFRPPQDEQEYALAERYKRATVAAATGDDTLFERWFTPDRPYAAFVADIQAFDPGGYVLAWHRGAAIGQMEMKLRKDGSGMLNNIYLLPEWRGKGLGADMNAHAMAFFRKHGAVRAALRTNPGNTKLITFYTRMGWELGNLCDNGMVWMGRAVD